MKASGPAGCGQHWANLQTATCTVHRRVDLTRARFSKRQYSAPSGRNNGRARPIERALRGFTGSSDRGHRTGQQNPRRSARMERRRRRIGFCFQACLTTRVVPSLTRQYLFLHSEVRSMWRGKCRGPLNFGVKANREVISATQPSRKTDQLTRTSPNQQPLTVKAEAGPWRR